MHGRVGLGEVYEFSRGAIEALGRIVRGYSVLPRLFVAGLLSAGHILLEGVPGVAKTSLVRAAARLLGVLGVEEELWGARFRGFSRIQFTPDLLPSDVTGGLVWDPGRRTFVPQFGPVFAYLVLADEVNRASPRTQAALLEAMQERQVSMGGVSYKLEDRGAGKWFLVVATQNPVEQEGTYPLPEAQLDRFAVRLLVGYPESLEEEVEAYKLHLYRLTEPLEDLEPLVEHRWLAWAQEAVAREVEVPAEVVASAAELVRLTRPSVSKHAGDYFELGASPRAGIALLRYAKALAATRGSGVVEHRDLLEALFPVLNHRVIPRVEAVVERGGGLEARLSVIVEGISSVAEAVLGEKPPVPPLV